MNAQILADELHSKGFRTRVITSTSIEVSLTARKVSAMEVSQALFEIFQYWHAFNVIRQSNGTVIVSE
jgi:hypothetical protein